MADVTIGSLFSGIGGLELGLERATGARTIWQVEADPFCLRVLKRHWPHATRYDDVCTASALPFVDVMCGGFPCQDISVAGRGAGIDGTRSGLWREFARLVGEVRPRVVVVENVAALASRGLARVLRDLAALGYVGSWEVVSAASVGAPHLRRRLFVVAADSDCGAVRDERWWGEAWARARRSTLWRGAACCRRRRRRTRRGHATPQRRGSQGQHTTAGRRSPTRYCWGSCRRRRRRTRRMPPCRLRRRRGTAYPATCCGLVWLARSTPDSSSG